MFWGATIVGRELEAGTATLVWTQSITRRRWLSTKLLTLFVFTAACSGVVAGLVTWWSDAHNLVVESRFNGLQFDIQGIAPVGYALFASALGLAAGVLWRRALPAMATTVGGFVGVRLVVELAVRWHYMSPVTTVNGLDEPTGLPSGAWVKSSDLVLHGQVLRGPVRADPTCALRDVRECMTQRGYQMRTVYQPAGRYWTFQWIEFGIFAGLAVILVAVAVVVLRRHDA
jgi:H+/Cl- antiporter ClcA